LESILEFARGPLFRLSFAVMALGLLRILLLDIWGAILAYRKAGDKDVPWAQAIKRSLSWLFPFRRAFGSRPLYSLSSILFHIGLILVPLFLYAHVQLWKGGIGWMWPAIPKVWADYLTLATIVFGLAVFFGRALVKSASFLSRKQDFFWPLLLIVPFFTGFLCANTNLSPSGYQFFMLIHVLAAELIFLLIPFTKIAHCVIMPLSQFVLALAWKFPPDTDEPICISLNKKGIPI
jgi:nitrate reductase gamma subunit